MARQVCRTLCHDVAAVVVVAVDYRLAPEHPFPAAVDDVACALRWAAAHARAAGAIALRAQSLIYPVAQHYSEPSPSMLENGEDKFLATGVMQWFVDCCLGGRRELARHADFALLHAQALETLPPTWLATMGHDPLRADRAPPLPQRHPRLHSLHRGIGAGQPGDGRHGRMVARVTAGLPALAPAAAPFYA